MPSSVSAGNAQAPLSATTSPHKIHCDKNDSKFSVKLLRIVNTDTELSSAKSSKETHLRYPETQQFAKTTKTVNKFFKKEKTTPKNLKFIGTVKLNGRNSSVANNLLTGDTHYQTRNQVISPKKNQSEGFMSFANSENNKCLFKIAFSDIKGVSLSIETYAVIFGEWCGKGVMKDAAANDAINKLEPLFVIFDIGLFEEGKKGCRFLPTETVCEIIKSAKDKAFSSSKGISPNEARIFSIYEFGTHNITIDFSDDEKIDHASAELSQITRDVAKQCPVAKHLGQEGAGEGMIWRLDNSNNKLPNEMSGTRFKVVGPKHAESKGDDLAPANVKIISSEKEFIETVLTESRMEKVLRGMPAEQCREPSAFFQALTKDILKEEESRLAVSGIPSEKVHTLLKPEASKWFKNLHAK